MQDAGRPPTGGQPGRGETPQQGEASHPPLFSRRRPGHLEVDRAVGAPKQGGHVFQAGAARQFRVRPSHVQRPDLVRGMVAAGGTWLRKDVKEAQDIDRLPIVAFGLAGRTLAVAGPPNLINEEYAFERMAEGMVITNAAGRILTVNQSYSRITGFAPEEVLGRQESDFRSAMQPPGR